MAEWEGKVALVTGAGRMNGIGAAIALKLAQGGAQVIVSDYCQPAADLPNSGSPEWDELQAVASRIEERGVRCLPLQADVTQADQVRQMVARLKEEFGRLDILVNNAGVVVAPSPVVAMDERAWRRTLEVNATGTFLCSQAALPLMIEGDEGGRVINIASIAAIKPRPFLSAYAASKAAVVALTKSLAQEVAEYGITVNAVLPGDVDTAMKQWGFNLEAMVTSRPQEQVVSDLVAKIPVGRLGLPQDIANAVAFLASSQAEFITGQAINLTGGRELT